MHFLLLMCKEESWQVCPSYAKALMKFKDRCQCCFSLSVLLGLRKLCPVIDLFYFIKQFSCRVVHHICNFIKLWCKAYTKRKIKKKLSSPLTELLPSH